MIDWSIIGRIFGVVFVIFAACCAILGFIVTCLSDVEFTSGETRATMFLMGLFAAISALAAGYLVLFS